MPIVGGLIGKKFGKLRVIAQAGRGPRGVSYRCLCVCGQIIKASTFALETDDVKSCGCGYKKSDRRQPVPTELRKRHPLTVKSWEAMLARCHYKKDKGSYEGVEICDEWYSFENFFRDMGERPSINHSLDRKKPELGYNKENCQWITKRENSSKVRWWLRSQNKPKKPREGQIVSKETREKISKGALKRVGRKLQNCVKCGNKSYLSICQKCRMEADSKQRIEAAKRKFEEVG